jgi:hypothetical protein
MTQPSRFWRIAAVLFVIVNVAGGVYALRQGEQMHAELHLVLFGVAYVWYLFLRPRSLRKSDIPPAELGDPRIERLQQSVDAVALEVERIGEAQRFQEKLKTERKEKPNEP